MLSIMFISSDSNCFHGQRPFSKGTYSGPQSPREALVGREGEHRIKVKSPRQNRKQFKIFVERKKETKKQPCMYMYMCAYICTCMHDNFFLVLMAC